MLGHRGSSCAAPARRCRAGACASRSGCGRCRRRRAAGGRHRTHRSRGWPARQPARRGAARRSSGWPPPPSLPAPTARRRRRRRPGRRRGRRCSAWAKSPRTCSTAPRGGAPIPTRRRAKSLCLQLTDDRAQPVVAAGAAVLAQPQPTERQGHVVDDDEEFVEGNTLSGQHLANGDAREVHVGRGLDEDELPIIKAATHGGRAVARLRAAAAPVRSARRSSTIQPMLWRVFS